MNPEAKVLLLKEVVDAIRLEGDPDLTREIGDDLFEVLASIIDHRDQHVPFTELIVGRQDETIRFLRSKFPHGHAVWEYIKVVKERPQGDLEEVTTGELDKWFHSMEYQS